MPEFPRFDEIVLSPTRCFSCQTHEGPVYLLGQDMAALPVQLCVGCITQLARLTGCSDPGVAEALREQVAAQDAVIQELQDQVEIEKRRQVSVVSLDLLRKELAGVGAKVAETERPERPIERARRGIRKAN